MTDLPEETSHAQAPPPEPAGFAKIARSLTRRTTDLLAVAILAVGLLAVGGKLTRWWNTSPEDVASNIPPLPQTRPWGAGGQGVTLEWGDLDYAIHHQMVKGDVSSAAEQLEQIALGRFVEIRLPRHPPSRAELNLLAELEKVPPSRTLPSGEAVYRFGPELPMVLITKPDTRSSESDDSPSSRVVCWARAFPKSAEDWMVIVLLAAESQSSDSRNEADIPLPAGCRRIQAIHDAGGSSWLSFRGSGPVRDWQVHFEDWFAKQNWTMARPWSNTGGTWTAAFVSPQINQRADVWLNDHPNGSGEGMVLREIVSSASAEH